MSLDTERAIRAVLARAVTEVVDEMYEEIREGLALDMLPGDRAAAILDGVPLGAVQVTAPKPRLSVVDWSELMAWAMVHRPEAIVTSETLSRSWVSRVTRGDGEWTDPDTGEVLPIPGLGVTTDVPQLRVTLTDEARGWARRALAARLTIPTLTTGDQA